MIELERRLDPPEVAGQPHPTRRSVQRAVKAYLTEIKRQARAHPEMRTAATYLCQIFRQRWRRLFVCYAWPERYRTNNDLETYFSRLRTRQRRVQGHKSVHEFILRYGEWAIYVDDAESFEQVLVRFQQFEQQKFDSEYARFLKVQKRFQILYRFRHHPQQCLTQLEQQWAEAQRNHS